MRVCVSGPMISCTSPPEQKLPPGAGQHDGFDVASSAIEREIGRAARRRARTSARFLRVGPIERDRQAPCRRSRSARFVIESETAGPLRTSFRRCCERSRAGDRRERRSAECRARRARTAKRPGPTLRHVDREEIRAHLDARHIRAGNEGSPTSARRAERRARRSASRGCAAAHRLARRAASAMSTGNPIATFAGGHPEDATRIAASSAVRRERSDAKQHV